MRQEPSGWHYRRSLASRVTLLTTLAVALTVGMVALGAYITVRVQMQATLDASLISEIVKQDREIRTAEFCTLDQVHERCADFTARRIDSGVDVPRSPEFGRNAGRLAIRFCRFQCRAVSSGRNSAMRTRSAGFRVGLVHE